MTIAAVILAGGEGARIGGGKAERLLNGRTLLEWALAGARAQADCVAVSVRRLSSQCKLDGAPAVVDNPDLAGPIAGLSAALDWARAQGAEWLLTLPCDTPFAPADLAARLCEAARAGGVRCAAAMSNGVLHPSCAVWSTELGEALAAYVGAGRRSLTGFLTAAGGVAVEWAATSYDPFFNINSVADLANAEALTAHMEAASTPTLPQARP